MHIKADYRIDDVSVACVRDKGFFITDECTKEPHMHTDYELHAVSDGSYPMEFLNTGKTVTVGAGELILIPPGVYHSTLSGDSSDKRDDTGVSALRSCRRRTMRLHFTRITGDPGINGETGELYDRLLAVLPGKNDPPVLLTVPGAEELLQTVSTELTSSAAGSAAMADALMTRFLVLLLRTLVGETEGTETPAGTGERLPYDPSLSESDTGSARETKIALYLNSHYALPELTEAMLADALHLSRRQTARLIDCYYHMTFREMLTQIRMNHAVRLLIRTDMPVSEIASAVGFLSPSAFFTAFRGFSGMAPGVYRREKRKSE